MSAPPERAAWLDPDSEGMLAATLALGDHVSAALEEEVLSLERPDHLVVLGMGGSGVAGAVLRAFAGPGSPVPIVLGEGYDVPGFVGPGSLVIAVSFSGETEETLAATAACLTAHARVVAVTRGGNLAELVAEGGGAVVGLPDGIPQPRAGLGAMASRVLLLAESAGVAPGARRALEDSVASLGVRMASLADGGGEAAEVARRIGRTIPLVYGQAGLAGVAARRWKTQINENAKAPAFAGEQPEVSHNEICGFGQGGDITRQLLSVVELTLPGDDARVRRRHDLLAELVDEAVGDVITVEGSGDSDLAAFFDLVAIGDVASLHLATREGVDPGPVPVLTEIKRRLKER